MIPQLKYYFKEKEDSYRNKYSVASQWPVRITISGASGTGKTNILLNLILQYLTFDKLYVYAKDLCEAKYDFLQKVCAKFEEDVLFAKDRNIISVDDLDPEKQNLIVFDDYVTENSCQQKIEDLFIRGRKKNASIIYLTQSYYRTPKNIRLQCDYIILMKSCNQREISLILKEHSVSDSIKQKYNYAIQQPYNFFLLDLKRNQFRKNFDTPL